jgi:hypothetical protein
MGKQRRGRKECTFYDASLFYGSREPWAVIAGPLQLTYQQVVLGEVELGGGVVVGVGGEDGGVASASPGQL